MNSNKFPVNIEKFAAFLDGNLEDSEMQAISNIVKTHPILQEQIYLSEQIDSEILSYDTDSSDFLNEIEIPVIEDSDIDVDDELCFINIFNEDSINGETLIQNSHINEQINNHIMGKVASYTTYGEHGENIYDPIFIQQPDDHSCALRSQQIVLRDFGIDIPFEDLEKIALEAGVYTNEGTYTCDIGKVLQIAGVDMHQVEGSTIYDLTNELSQGHRVIVSVDAHELWYNDGIVNKTTNWLSDVFGEQGGNHALIVAGVEVNPDNPDDVKVVLTDPGAGHLRIEYPIDQFMDAWQDSNCFMAATDDAAPFQYDAHTGMEVPSNFAAEQFYNQFIVNNSYQLNPDMINIPADYQPAYNGNLDMLGDVSYEDFHDKYGSLTAARQEFLAGNPVGNAVESLICDLKGLFTPHHNPDDIAQTNDEQSLGGDEHTANDSTNDEILGDEAHFGDNGDSSESVDDGISESQDDFLSCHE